ncbi:RagB/SusD family nutrient uptake outer membrane protein [uncultured Algibacter sp.]|uniref:RagB/SusD family nutrient uptake outer membrane protein n=1 Tax=uncultured Algibacter sp. TaxID=298659 RepID=UPI0032167260
MKAKFIYKIIPVVLLTLVFQSCEKDFLEETNPNELTLGSFWTNNTDLNSGLISAYSALKNNAILGIEDETVRTDIAVPGLFRARQIGNSMFNQEYTENTAYVASKWSALYLGIFRANQVIVNQERIAETYTTEEAEEEGLRILAQARALRGYFYFVLNNSYNDGSVPLFDFVPETFDDFQQPFSTSQAIKDFYRADLMFGIENLPGNYGDWQNEDLGNDNLGRITAGACEAFLAKSFINENNFDMAEQHLKNVMDNYGYSLVDDVARCFTGIDEFNSESIFEINYTTAVNLEADGEEVLSQRITHAIYNARIQPSSLLTLKYRNERVDSLDIANTVLRDSLDLVGNIVKDAAGNDLKEASPVVRTYSIRMGNSMGFVDDPDSPMYGVRGGVYGRVPGVAPYAKNRNAMFKKYLHWNTIGGGAGEDRSVTLNNRSDINIMVIRLAEIYLNYAECMLEKGDLSEALRYINRVRKRSHVVLLGKANDPGAEFNDGATTYLDDIDMDASNGLETVNTTNLMEHLRLTEMPLELSLEGDRATDLRRWGIFQSVIQDMSNIKYDYWHYGRNLNGNHPTRFRCFTTLSGENPPYDTAIQGVRSFSQPPEVQDKVAAASRFDPSLHNYLPIPRVERDSNLNSDTVK